MKKAFELLGGMRAYWLGALILVLLPSLASAEVEKKRHTAKRKLYLKAEADTKSKPRKTGDLGELPLTIQEAVIKSLKNNVAISVASFDPKIRAENIIFQEAAFDPSLSFLYDVQDQVKQTASAFAFPLAVDTRTDQWNASFKQKLMSGTQYELQFNNQKFGTNSVFAALNPQYYSELNLILTQPLLKNFGLDANKYNIYISQNNAEISGNDFRQKVIDVITDTETGYWDMVFSVEDLRVKEKSLERARDFYRLVKAQVDVGTMAPLDIAQAKSEVATREGDIINSKDLVSDKEDILKNIMNMAFDSEDGAKVLVPINAPEVIKDDIPSLADAIKYAFKYRPDYLSKKKDLDNKKIITKFNENQLYPSLDLVSTLGLNGLSGTGIPITNFSTGRTFVSPFAGNYADAIDQMFKTDYRTWDVGMRLTYPLGNRAAQSQYTASKLDTQKALFDIKDLEKKIIVDVREAVRQLDTDSRRVEATRIARQYAEEKLDAEEKKFKVGLSTSFAVLTFQEDLAVAQSKEILALTDFNKTKARMRKAIASTLEEYQIELNTRTSKK